MRKLLSTIFFIFLLSCKDIENNQNIINIVVDKNENINFSDLFNEYKFIFPESKDPGWIGITILKIEIINDNIFLLNQTQTGNNILCFDSKGRFKFTINKIGQGPGEYNFLNDFFIDKHLNLLVLDVVGNQFGFREYIYYDYNGSYLCSKSRQVIKGTPKSMIVFNDSLYVCNVSCSHKDNCTDIIFFNKHNLDVFMSFNCVDKYTDIHTPKQSLCNTSESLLFYGGNDIIYIFSEEQNAMIPAYFVDFGSKQKSYKKNIVGKTYNEIMDMHRQSFMNKEIRIVDHFFANDKFFAINYSENKNVDKKYDLCYKTVFFDKETKQIFNTNNIYFDIFNFVKNEGMEIIGCYDGFFYSLLNTPFTKDEIKEIVKSEFLSDDIKLSFLKLNEESNPVIFIFK